MRFDDSDRKALKERWQLLDDEEVVEKGRDLLRDDSQEQHYRLARRVDFICRMVAWCSLLALVLFVAVLLVSAYQAGERYADTRDRFIRELLEVP